MNPRNIFVTGANGYLGGWVCRFLRERGHLVYGTDSRFRHFCGEGSMERALLVADAVIHLAWFVSAGDSLPSFQEDSVDRTERLISDIYSKCSRLGRFLFTSTASVYGNLPDTEEASETYPINPGCAYTRCKAEAEEIIHSRLPSCYTILRLGSLMGRGVPGGRTKTDLIVNAFATDAYRTGTIEVWNPFSYRPIIHVQDAARIILRIVENGFEDKDGKGNGDTINVAAWSMRATDIAYATVYYVKKGGEQQPLVNCVESPNGSRSCRLNCGKLMRWVRESGLPPFRSITETVEEFRDYIPTEGDKTDKKRWKVEEEVERTE